MVSAFVSSVGNGSVTMVWKDPHKRSRVSPLNYCDNESAMGFGRQLGAVLWKNAVIYRFKRHYVVTFFELLIPIGLVCVVAYLRSLGGTQGPAEWKNQTIFAPENIRDLIIPPGYTLIYAPNSSYVDFMVQTIFGRAGLNLIGFKDEAALNEYLENLLVHKVDATLVFQNAHPSVQGQPALDYTVGFNTSYLDFQTNSRFPARLQPGPRSLYDDKYRLLFLALQQKMFDVHMQYLNLSDSLKDLSIQLHRQPYPGYLQDDNFASLTQLIPIFIVYGFIMVCPVFVLRAIRDKSSRVKELLRMMGLSDWVHWLGMFLNGYIVMATCCIVTTIVFKVEWVEGVRVLMHTDGTIMGLILLLYSVAALLFLMVFTVIFNSPVTGTIVATIMWFFTYGVPVNFMDPPGSDKYSSLSSFAKLSSALLPNANLYWCFRLIGFMETVGEGAQWYNIAQPSRAHDNVVLLQFILIMLLSCFLYAFLIFYLDNVWPFQYGVPKHPLFIFQKSYWRESQVQPYVENPGYKTALLGNDAASVCNQGNGGLGDTSDLFEEAPSSFGNPTIDFYNVSKEFPGQKRKAVDNLSLKMYQNQITVLLGHNGAGKTTTMNILTGLYPPSSGRIYINGLNVLSDTRRARRGIGLCPQHNVLFDELTVQEHLEFFAAIKGSIKPSEEIPSILSSLELTAKRDTLAKSLSGGMKRKLSLANALVGGSNVVILDEPTAGMDPQARRAVWQLLQNIRRSRTILLTTHYMEEADVLGDRIAFMASGKLKCAGSPIFLKKRFGTGYKVRIAKSEAGTFDQDRFVGVIQRFVPGSHLESEISHECICNVGFPDAQQLVPLFEELEQKKEFYGVSSLGVSVTTMEDVFIRVGELDEDATSTDGGIERTKSSSVFMDLNAPPFPQFTKLSGLELYKQQFKGLFLKRFNATRRQLLLLLFMVVIPFIVMSVYCVLDKNLLKRNAEPEPMIEYQLSKLFGPTQSFFTGDFEAISKFASPLFNSWKMSSSNVSGMDVNEYLLGFAERDLNNYITTHLMGVEYSESNKRMTMWYSGEPFHVSACALNFAHNTLIRKALNSGVGTEDSVYIRVANQPFTGGKNKAQLYFDMPFRILASLFIPVAMSFLVSSFILFAVHERVSKAKLLQLMTGVNPLLFFLASFLFDYLLCIVCSVLVMLPLWIFNPNNVFFEAADISGSIFVLFLLYGWCSVPLSYLASYVFDSATFGFGILTVVNVFTGVVLSMVFSVLEFLGQLGISGIDLDAVYRSMWFCRFLPNFSLAWGFSNAHQAGALPSTCRYFEKMGQIDLICASSEFSKVLEHCCQPCMSKNSTTKYCYSPINMFSWTKRGAAEEMFALFCVGLILFTLLFFLETNLQRFYYRAKNAVLSVRRGRQNSMRNVLVDDNSVNQAHASSSFSEDDDVAAERSIVDRIIESGVRAQDEALIAHRLTKKFGSFRAVDNVTFRVHQKECFGLLGVNGAGKTTTFRMLTGDLMMSSGNAYIKKYDVQDDLLKFQSFIGYCPQFDALIDKLTGKETLELFCRLRGVCESEIADVVNHMIDVTDIYPHRDKSTENYSGGNKRKLSIGLALIGAPSVIFLDEPTAGVDPAARRKIWSTLEHAQQQLGAAVVLTSHSMEECEALCHRLCIMVNGQFRCLGATQHLKSKFGQGFTVLIKLKHDEYERQQELVNSICSAMDEYFPGENTLRNNHQSLLHFHITDTKVPWSRLFSTLDLLKKRFDFEDFVVSDTTLEQIFLSFAKTQRITDDSAVKAGSSCELL